MGFLLAFWGLIKAGFLEKFGEWTFGAIKGLWPKKKRKKGAASVVVIAKLQQKVKDMGINLKAQARRLNQTEKQLKDCEAGHTECRADLKNLMMRVGALERRA